MKYLLVFIAFFSFSCNSQKSEGILCNLCQNKVDLISKSDTVTDFEQVFITLPFDSFIGKYQNSDFPKYLEISKNLFVLVEFEGSNLSAEMRVVNSEEILINSNNKLLHESDIVELKDLSSSIIKNTHLDENLKFVVKWNDETSISFINQTFQDCVLGYFGLLEKTLEIDICTLSKDEINVLKRKYPLVFKFQKLNSDVSSLPLTL